MKSIWAPNECDLGQVGTVFQQLTSSWTRVQEYKESNDA
jgi:hypothetical protein